MTPVGGAGGGQARTHLEGQVGGDGDAGAQVDVAVLVAHEKGRVALGLGSHPDTTAVLGPRLQPPCKNRAAVNPPLPKQVWRPFTLGLVHNLNSQHKTVIPTPKRTRQKHTVHHDFPHQWNTPCPQDWDPETI